MDIIRWKYAIIQRTAHRIQRRGYRMICHPTDLHDEYNVTNWWNHTAWNFYRVRKDSLIADMRGELRTYSVRNFARVNPLEALSWRCSYHRSDPQWIIQPRRIGLDINNIEIHLHIVDGFRTKHEVYRIIFDRYVIYSHHRSNLCTIMCT